MSSELPPGFGPNDPTAPEQVENDYAQCGFKVSEYAPHGNPPKAEPWIGVEIASPGLKILRAGESFLRFECRDGVSIGEVDRLASEMHRLLIGITCAKWLT